MIGSFSALLIALCFSWAGPNDEGKNARLLPSSEVNLTEPVSFRSDIVPLFQTKCNQEDCHGRKGSAFPKFTSHAMIKAKAKKIIRRLEDDKDPMPPSDASVTMTQQEVAMFKRWVEEGAQPN